MIRDGTKWMCTGYTTIEKLTVSSQCLEVDGLPPQSKAGHELPINRNDWVLSCKLRKRILVLHTGLSRGPPAGDEKRHEFLERLQPLRGELAQIRNTRATARLQWLFAEWDPCEHIPIVALRRIGLRH